MSSVTTTRAEGFQEAQRHLAGLTARAEKRALLWLAPRTPGWITSDHLTLLGLVAMAACGALYALAGRLPWLLLLVNVGLAVNWLGDSLDGTLARHRGVERHRRHEVDEGAERGEVRLGNQVRACREHLRQLHEGRSELGDLRNQRPRSPLMKRGGPHERSAPPEPATLVTKERNDERPEGENDAESVH